MATDRENVSCCRRLIRTTSRCLIVAKKKIVDATNAFANQTNMHAFKFFYEPHVWQRVFWVLFWLTVLGVNVHLIVEGLHKWRVMPIVTSQEASSTPNWDLAFPALTVCNMNQVKLSQAREAGRLMEADPTNISTLVKVALIEELCGLQSSFNESIKVQIEESANTKKEIESYLGHLGHSCQDMLSRCAIAGNQVPCDQLFKSVDTFMGSCCTFNMVRDTYHNYDGNGRPIPDDLKTKDREVPFKPIGTGLSRGVTFLLNVQLAEYFCSRFDSEGFRMRFHNPDSFSFISNMGIGLSAGTEYFIPVTPSVMHTDESIHDWQPHHRDCFLAHERGLAYFTRYTHRNCYVECAFNRTVERCGCTPHLLARSDNQSVCGPIKMRCSLDELDKFRGDFTDVDGCNCLQSCSEITYEKEISSMPLPHAYWKDDRYGALVNSNSAQSAVPNSSEAALVHVFFKEGTFETLRHSERFSTEEIVAHVAGLMSLFLGFSVISIVEIVYFYFVRICFPSQKQPDATE